MTLDVTDDLILVIILQPMQKLSCTALVLLTKLDIKVVYSSYTVVRGVSIYIACMTALQLWACNGRPGLISTGALINPGQPGNKLEAGHT